MNKNTYITAAQLSHETGFTPNAIRLKRRNTNWRNPNISIKKSRKLVEFNVFGYNSWCVSKNPPVEEISSDNVQFILFKKFKILYGITITELSRFCEYTNLQFRSLVIIAPDGNKMVNLELYRKNIYSLLKFLKVI